MCVIAGTLVEMSDGSLKPVETVKAMQTVKAPNGDVCQVAQLVRRLYTGNLVTIWAPGRNVSVTATQQVLRKHAVGSSWDYAGAVRVGDKLWFGGNDWRAVSGVQTQPAEAYPVFCPIVNSGDVYSGNGFALHS